MGWFRKSAATGASLIGRWRIDPTDEAAVGAFGNASLEFDERGNLIYIVKEGTKDQIILMTYHVIGDTVVTNQPSHPDPQSTHFKVSGDILSLAFGGQPARFLRAPL